MQRTRLCLGTLGIASCSCAQRALRKTKIIFDLCDERDRHIKRKLERNQESIKRDQEIRTAVKDLTDIMDNIAKVHKQFMKKKKKFSEEEIRQKNQFLMEVMQEAKLAIERSNSRPDHDQQFQINSGVDMNKVAVQLLMPCLALRH